MEHFSSPYANELAVAIAAAKKPRSSCAIFTNAPPLNRMSKVMAPLSPMPILPPIALSGNDSRAHFQMTRS